MFSKLKWQILKEYVHKYCLKMKQPKLTAFINARHIFTKVLPRSSCKHKNKPVKKPRSKAKDTTISPNIDFTEVLTLYIYILLHITWKIKIKSYTPINKANFSKYIILSYHLKTKGKAKSIHPFLKLFCLPVQLR